MFDKQLTIYKNLNPNDLTEKQFQNLEHEINHPNNSNTISDEYLDFKLWCLGQPSRQESFANYLAKKLNNHDGIKVLEVGGGRTARLSKFLQEKGYNMTCMDPNLDLKTVTNVKLIKEYFNYKTSDISSYDYVIAQEPCDATEHIVRACINQNKPFIMSLCGVPHKQLNGKIPKDEIEWYNYLIYLSPSIKIRFINFDEFTVTPILKNF